MPPRLLPPDAIAALANNLKAARQQAGIASQGTAAAKAGLRQNTLSLWETGEQVPGIEGLLRLAAAYGCSVDDLVGAVYEPYDEIIERRVPLQIKRYYAAKLAALRRVAVQAMDALTAASETAPTGVTPAGGRPRARDKSRPIRARRTRPK